MLVHILITGFVGGLLFSNALPAVQKHDLYSASQIGSVYQETGELPRKKDINNLGLITESKAVLAADQKTNKYLIAKEERTKMSIASITKLMSMLVFLDYEIDWEAEVEYKREYYREGSGIVMRPGEKFLVKDLFQAVLVASANNAVATLVAATGSTEQEFVQKMNAKAKKMGMVDTSFRESTGLSKYNQSTASDLTLLINEVLKSDRMISALRTSEYSFKTTNTESSRTVKNNNDLLESFINQGEYQLLVGKTGYTVEAGYCMLLALQKDNAIIYVIVLGSQLEEQRFQEAKSLAYWSFENFEFGKP